VAELGRGLEEQKRCVESGQLFHGASVFVADWSGDGAAVPAWWHPPAAVTTGVADI
jgi:hypothetical protein